MKWLNKLRAINASEAVRTGQLISGILLIIMSPFVGVLPGPGGTIVFALGLGLVLRNSLWAKRRYVMFKRKRPKMGGWADWGLRRRSAKRRDERKKQARQSGD